MVQAKLSAGLLMYRRGSGGLEVLLVHPGGPFFQNKEQGAWTIPKGLPIQDEDLLDTARREFEEETGVKPSGPFTALKPVKQKGGKTVHAWAFEGDCEPDCLVSNTFKMQWPPKSGRYAEFPEVDKAAFFDLETAKTKINPAQAAFLDELKAQLGEGE